MHSTGITFFLSFLGALRSFFACFWSGSNQDTSAYYIPEVRKPRQKSLNRNKDIKLPLVVSNGFSSIVLGLIWHFWTGFDKLCSCESILVTHGHNPNVLCNSHPVFAPYMAKVSNVSFGLCNRHWGWASRIGHVFLLVHT